MSIFGGGDSALDWAVELSKKSQVILYIDVMILEELSQLLIKFMSLLNLEK